MRLLLAFVARYPRQTLWALAALLAAGLVEGLSLTTLLPLLALASPSPAAAPGSESMSEGVGKLIRETLSSVGLEPTIGILLGIIVVGMTLKGALMLLANRQVGRTVAHIATDLRTELVGALLATRWEYYLHQPVGSFANAAATEARRSSMAYLHSVRYLSLFIQAAVYAGVAALASWKMTLAGLLTGGVVLFALNGLVRKTRRAGAKQTERLKDLVSRLTDGLQAVKMLKAMAREELADSLVGRENRRLNRALEHQIVGKEAVRALQEPLLGLLIAVGIYVALVVWHAPLPAVMIMMLLLYGTVLKMGKVQREYQEVGIGESAYWSLKAMIGRAVDQRESLGGRGQPSLEHQIAFKNVTFSYDEVEILQAISLTIPARKITCIIGPSGSGKTSLVDLVTGLLRPSAGEIWIDGQPLSEILMRSWRRMIGYVPQETLLLHDSVRNNVTLRDPKLSEADAERALRAARAWDFVSDLPEGMETSVGERGIRFSGGQRQRIAIARALVHQPSLLILDEATSAQDADGEKAVCATLASLRGKLTILAVAHTQALMQVADLVYRLEGGCLQETP